MDYTKWKSVAVRKDKYDIIKALCDKKYDCFGKQRNKPTKRKKRK